MKLSSLEFLIREGLQNIRRNGLMSLAALGTVTVSLTVLGASLWTAYRVAELADQQPRIFNEIDVFAAVGAARPGTLAMAERIRGRPDVQLVRIVTREAAWRDLEKSEPKLTVMESNPLPDKLEVVARDPAGIAGLVAVLNDRSQYPRIERVTELSSDVKMMLGIARLVKLIGTCVACGLFAATLFIVYNTIRLTVFARKSEIQIMQLVGATPGFIRFPLLLEGVFHGVAGALIAGVIVLMCGRQAAKILSGYQSLLSGGAPSRLGPVDVVSGLVAIGALVGLVGSHLAMRRFLRQI